MGALRDRLVKDLKADLKKTVIMVVLASVLVYAWLNVKFEKKGAYATSPSVEPASGSSKLTKVEPKDNEKVAQRIKYAPLYLFQPMPYEEIRFNPFKPIVKPPNSGKGLSPSDAVYHPEGALAREEEEKILSFKVTCTLTGRGEPYAIIDGNCLKLGEVYKGFTLIEIGDGYVKLAGKEVTKRIEVAF
jgi:hypothetical protein